MMPRHIWATFSVSFVYIVYNIILTKVDRRVYPGWTWDSVSGYLKPLSVVAGSLVVNYLMVRINQWKLGKLGT